MRLGGPIFQPFTTIAAEVALHQQLGFGAAYCRYIADNTQRSTYKQAFAEADIVLAEFGAYCIKILDTNPVLRQKNIDEICRRLEYADEMGVRCCVMHGGSVETGDWGNANPLNMSEKSFYETVTAIQSILDRVQPTTTKLVIETESYLLPDSPEIYARLIEAVDRPGFAVHLDPVNIIASPRQFYYNAQYIKQCFSILGPWIVSCHAKDITMPAKHATVQINETFIGDGMLDYATYLTEIEKLNPAPTLMIEHLDEQQLHQGLQFIFAQAAAIGITFEGARHASYMRDMPRIL